MGGTTLLLTSAVAFSTLVTGLTQLSAIQDISAPCDGKDPSTRFTFTSASVYNITCGIANSNIWAAKKQNTKGALTCVNKADHEKMYQASKGQFKIICGQKYGRGDLTSTTTSSFEASTESCASTALCIDVSYVNGACYLKQSVSSLIDPNHVWTAQLVNSQAKRRCYLRR
ncbi:hypothetical protein E8E11_004246 [Didymella keratinophila]|nr:hypothetical protein E8E11_004246 [Didymella keratinophila]